MRSCTVLGAGWVGTLGEFIPITIIFFVQLLFQLVCSGGTHFCSNYFHAHQQRGDASCYVLCAE